MKIDPTVSALLCCWGAYYRRMKYADAPNPHCYTESSHLRLRGDDGSWADDLDSYAEIGEGVDEDLTRLKQQWPEGWLAIRITYGDHPAPGRKGRERREELWSAEGCVGSLRDALDGAISWCGRNLLRR